MWIRSVCTLPCLNVARQSVAVPELALVLYCLFFLFLGPPIMLLGQCAVRVPLRSYYLCTAVLSSGVCREHVSRG